MLSSIYIGNCKDELIQKINSILIIEKQSNNDDDNNIDNNKNVKKRKRYTNHMKSIVIGTNDILIALEKNKLSYICLCPTGKTKKSNNNKNDGNNSSNKNDGNNSKSIKSNNQSLLDSINYNFKESDIHRSIIEASIMKNVPILVLLGVKPQSSPSSKRKVSELANLFNVKTLSCFALTVNDDDYDDDKHSNNDSISALKDGFREYLQDLSNNYTKNNK